MDKPQKEQKIEKKIGQLQNQQKTLLNRKRSEERRARTHRLIGRCAILEAIFPAVVDMEGEEVKAFLIALSRLPGSMEAMETAWKNEGGEVTPSPRAYLYTVPVLCALPGAVASFGRDWG